jgi:phosphate transport system substrate-binding protein
MPRVRKVNRGVALAACAAAVSLGVTSCTPPMPPDVLAAVAESQITCQSGDVAVAVPEQFVGSIAAVGAGLSGVCPDQTVTEVPVGDPAPVYITSGTPTTDEISAFTATQCTTGSVIEIPAFGYQVTVGFNVIGLEGLLFTPEAVAGVLNGTVTSFEDPLIAEPNEGYDLSGLPEITVLALDTPQGSVEAMTAWLTQQVPDQWTKGVVGTVEGAETFATTQELLDAMLMSDATLAILPTTTVISAGLAPASLPAYLPTDDGQKGELVTISPDDTQLAKVGAGATVVTADDAGNLTASPAIGGIPNPESFDLAASKVVLQEGQPLAGWPVVAVAHALICDSADNPLPLSFGQFLVRLAGQGSLEGFGFVPLPEPVRFQTFTPLKVTINTDAPVDPSATESP